MRANSFIVILSLASAASAWSCSDAGGSDTAFEPSKGTDRGAGGAGETDIIGSDGILGDDGGPQPAPSDGCAEGTRYVYVIDANNRMYRFDPSIASPSAFQQVGVMGCQAGEGPNSMSVGRDGFAYVLYGTDDPWGAAYACAGVYKVDIKTAACAGVSSFQCGSSGFNKFGMGFATDTAGSTSEGLYLSNMETTGLGRLDFGTGTVTRLGSLPGGAEFTGNANGELWGFFPDQVPPRVHQIDKSNGSILQSLSLSSLPDTQNATAYAYAFAFWGGSFYIFYQVEPNDSSTNVWKLDMNGSLIKYIPNTGLRIVGAGVSTCAPVGPLK